MSTVLNDDTRVRVAPRPTRGDINNWVGALPYHNCTEQDIIETFISVWFSSRGFFLADTDVPCDHENTLEDKPELPVPMFKKADKLMLDNEISIIIGDVSAVKPDGSIWYFYFYPSNTFSGRVINEKELYRMVEYIVDPRDGFSPDFSREPCVPCLRYSQEEPC